MVDINCLYLRLLFHKPFTTKENFFSQIGLQGLSIYGGETSDFSVQELQEGDEEEGN